MISETDEFELSRWLDNDLSAAAAKSLSRKLARTPELAIALAEFIRVDELLKFKRPGIQWDELANQISRRVQEHPIVRPSRGWGRTMKPF